MEGEMLTHKETLVPTNDLTAAVVYSMIIRVVSHVWLHVEFDCAALGDVLEYIQGFLQGSQVVRRDAATRYHVIRRRFRVSGSSPFILVEELCSRALVETLPHRFTQADPEPLFADEARRQACDRSRRRCRGR